MTDLGTLGGTNSRAVDINALGQIVGFASNASNETHATLWTVESATPVEATQSLIDEVTALVSAGSLTQGEGTSLLAKLNAALRKLDRSSGTTALAVATQEANPGDVKATINQLGAFINQVNAFVRSGRLTEEEGQSLIDAVQAIIDALAG